MILKSTCFTSLHRGLVLDRHANLHRRGLVLDRRAKLHQRGLVLDRRTKLLCRGLGYACHAPLNRCGLVPDRHALYLLRGLVLDRHAFRDPAFACLSSISRLTTFLLAAHPILHSLPSSFQRIRRGIG